MAPRKKKPKETDPNVSRLCKITAERDRLFTEFTVGDEEQSANLIKHINELMNRVKEARDRLPHVNDKDIHLLKICLALVIGDIAAHELMIEIDLAKANDDKGGGKKE